MNHKDFGQHTFYPVQLQMTGRQAAVLGGGIVAQRKVATLLEFGCQVTVISPTLTEELQSWAREGTIAVKAESFKPELLQGFFLVICATNQMEVNRQAAQTARELGALVNVVDDPALSDFTVPAHVKRDDFVLTVSTGGHSPKFAKLIRQELEEHYGPEYGQYLKLLGQIRGTMKERLKTYCQREAFWQVALNQDVLNCLKHGQWEEAEAKIRHAISSIRTES